MKEYLDKEGLQYYSEKVTTKYKTIFATKDEIGTPTKAATVSAMTDHDVIYLYTGSETGYTAGHIYYWNGSAWADGGAYGSQALDTTLTVPGEAADAKATGDAIEAAKTAVLGDVAQEYAKQDGFYENLGAGTANQLNSSVRVPDKVPFNFRTAGGSVDIGNRAFHKAIVGGTIAWNQLVQNGDFSNGTTNWSAVHTSISASNGVLTITPTSASATNLSAYNSIGGSWIPGHKYFVSAHLKANVATENTQLVAYNQSSGSKQIKGFALAANTETKIEAICGYATNNSSGSGNRLYFAFDTGHTHATTDTLEISKPMLIDLTLMFGSTIADYIYGLENATPGAGCNWFKKLFPKAFYAHNAGTLYSVKTSKAVNVGFNQWDEEWEEGAYDTTTGAKTNMTYRGRSKNKIPVLPSTVYYFKCNSSPTVLFYDGSENYISSVLLNGHQTFTIPDNACFITFFYGSSSTPAASTDETCINLSWDGSRDGEYETYEVNEYALNPGRELRGVFKLDANNKLYWDGDSYKSDGSVKVRYGVVDLGTLNWNATNEDGRTYSSNAAGIAVPSGSSTTPNVLCTKYVSGKQRVWYSGEIGDCITICGNGYGSPGQVGILVASLANKSAADVKSALSGVYLVYELATPNDSTADPYTSPMIVNDFGTESFNDADYDASNRDVEIPVGHDTEYPIDVLAKIEMAPNSPDGDDDYVLHQEGGLNTYIPLGSNGTIQAILGKLPDAPAEDGTYRLTVTVSGGVATYAWVSAT